MYRTGQLRPENQNSWIKCCKLDRHIVLQQMNIQLHMAISEYLNIYPKISMVTRKMLHMHLVQRRCHTVHVVYFDFEV